MKTKLMITGSTGFVGRNLVKYLEDNSKVDINIITRHQLESGLFDLSDGIVIHLVGKAHDLKSTTEPDEYYRINYELTKKIYDNFLKSDADKFIFISSVKAVADSVEGILTEDSVPNPQTHYGKSKLMAEKYIQSQFLPPGKSYYILRPCMIHGPGNKGNLNLLYKFVKTGIPYPLAGFNNRRSFLNIGNLCFVIKELIIRNNIPAGIYQISDDKSLSTSEVVSVLAASFNVHPRLWKIPQPIIRFVARAGDILKLPLTTERLNKMVENYLISNQKIKHTLNSELPLNSVEGLKITADSFNKA